VGGRKNFSGNRRGKAEKGLSARGPGYGEVQTLTSGGGEGSRGFWTSEAGEGVELVKRGGGGLPLIAPQEREAQARCDGLS